MRRASASGWNVAMAVAAAIWAFGQVLGQLAAPEQAVGAEHLPRSAAAAPQGRVAELPVDSRRRGDTTSGTVWHVGDGAWLSNRHVVEGCAGYELGARDRAGVDRLWVHPDADLAAVGSRVARVPVPLARSAPERRADAFAVGYPQGRPGIVELSLKAEGSMRLTGALRSERPFRYKVWGIRDLPEHVASPAGLGGISGGVVLDRSGRALGVAFGGNGRRGTLFTIPFAEMNAAASAIGAPSTEAEASGRTTSELREYAERLLRDDRVARVLCRY